MVVLLYVTTIETCSVVHRLAIARGQRSNWRCTAAVPICQMSMHDGTAFPLPVKC